MSEAGEAIAQCRESVTSKEEYEASGAEDQPEQSLRRSQRARTLTEKARELQAERIKALHQRFTYIYAKWRTQVKSAKQSLSQTEALSDDLLNDIIGDVTGLLADVQRVYEDLRKVTAPNQEARRRVDQCVEISKFIVDTAAGQLGRKLPEEGQEWPEGGSVFDSSICKSGFVMSILKGASDRSNRSSIKRQEAAADVAASQAVLEVLEEQEREQLEIQHIEAEVKRKIAEQEAADIKWRLKREEEEIRMKSQVEQEHLALQKTLEEKRRRIQHLEAVKNLSAARARMLVYDQSQDVEEERKDVLEKTVTVNKVPVSTNPVSAQGSSKPAAKIFSSNEDTVELVKVLASALSSNRIPIPEPSVFSGDPLSYNDWKLSFKALIDQKNIQEKEKIYYLRRYVSGQAKKALDGYFLLGTESAYAAAWALLEERYGNPFTIAKAYRDKLQAWPKIGIKDSFDLREFVDFLRSCEAAMVHIKALEISNDCNENRRILSKLPDWLTARWNRKTIQRFARLLCVTPKQRNADHCWIVCRNSLIGQE
ncbi:uncharacterized protein LOC129604426 [Betta splendens]|uniref:Uncharacterized protein LOC129604426 n=1 Tax=Betta splendens TaxID=158456 RepID=A0A9W2XYC4_BETSP|nr:uncharacterized protein LOC129604426 [Betta splendens]